MLLNQIADLIRQSIGMDAGTVGHLSLANAVRARMAACGTGELQPHWELLEQPGGQLARLIELVVVPETWFFRVPGAFSALTRFVSQEWLPAHPHGRLRILSAPCSTGEEPYSIAMALLDAGFSPERFRIDAVDISHRALDQARQAVYGRNSFRSDDLNFRERYFSEVLEGYQLHAAVRKCVKFRHGNLVADEAFPEMGGCDVIFCRNVLIYFDTATQKEVVQRLARRLTPEGLLFVGPAETFMTRSAGFSTMDFPGAFVCRRTGTGDPPPAALVAPSRLPAFLPWSPPREGSAEEITSGTLPDQQAGRVSDPAPASIITGISPASGITLEAAAGLASAGRLPEAFSMAEAYLREYDSSADAYCLLGLIRDTMEDSREAAILYRKALYLEPAHHDTLLHLALLVEKQGDPEGARRLRGRAQRSGEVIT